MMSKGIKVFIFLELMSSIMATPTTIIASTVVKDNVIPENTKEDLKSIFGHCLHKKDVSKCLKRRVVDIIDDVTKSNDPLSTTFFNFKLSLSKNPKFKENHIESDSSRNFEDIISQKFRNLLDSRLIQIKLTDDAKENEELSGDANEARKKKGGGGGKHGMMMSGIGLMAFLGQIFLSKVAFMSGAALLLAKIALLFSALSSLKKSSASGGGEHVVYSADVGKQGWQRSIHTMSPIIAQQQVQSSDDLAYHGHSTMPFDGV